MSPGFQLAATILLCDMLAATGEPEHALRVSRHHVARPACYALRDDIPFPTEHMDKDLRLPFHALHVQPRYCIWKCPGAEKSETGFAMQSGVQRGHPPRHCSEKGRHPWGPDILLQLNGRVITDHRLILPASFVNLMADQ
jgi:hypothetical protein